MERLSVSSRTKEFCVPALSNPGVRSSAGVLIAEYLVIKKEDQGGLKTRRAGRCAAALGAGNSPSAQLGKTEKHLGMDVFGRAWLFTRLGR